MRAPLTPTTNAMEEPSPPECFICTDTTPVPRKSACKCTDRYVHDDCLVKMLETARHSRCPVCAAPYTNVRSSSRIVGFKWESMGMCSCLMLLSSIVLAACATNTWLVLCCKARPLSGASLAVVLAAAVLMTVVALGLVLLLMRLFVLRGVAMIVQSMLLRQLTVRVLAVPARTLPAEVAMTPLA